MIMLLINLISLLKIVKDDENHLFLSNNENNFLLIAHLK